MTATQGSERALDYGPERLPTWRWCVRCGHHETHHAGNPARGSCESPLGSSAFCPCPSYVGAQEAVATFDDRSALEAENAALREALEEAAARFARIEQEGITGAESREELARALGILDGIAQHGSERISQALAQPESADREERGHV